MHLLTREEQLYLAKAGQRGTCWHNWSGQAGARRGVLQIPGKPSLSPPYGTEGREEERQPVTVYFTSEQDDFR